MEFPKNRKKRSKIDFCIEEEVIFLRKIGISERFCNKFNFSNVNEKIPIHSFKAGFLLIVIVTLQKLFFNFHPFPEGYVIFDVGGGFFWAWIEPGGVFVFFSFDCYGVIGSLTFPGTRGMVIG